jgi:hypothetical protein|tara:strand:+ start:330 stop:731 length:402 start_codon:yes stop_codon:yes gene_type:complete
MKLLLLSSFIFIISGCSTLGGLFGKSAVPVVAPVEIVTITVPAPIYHPPLPESVTPAEIEWIVLNPSVMRTYITDYDNGDAPALAYYGLTNQAYENLANNLADIRRYILQLLHINRYYRDNDPTRKTEAEEEQ